MAYTLIERLSAALGNAKRAERAGNVRLARHWAYVAATLEAALDAAQDAVEAIEESGIAGLVRMEGERA